MDPLAVFGGFGELVDPILRDFKPITDANFFTGIVRELSNVVNLSYWHFSA
jgi:hypothetical protein